MKRVTVYDLITEKDEYEPVRYHVHTYQLQEYTTYLLVLSAKEDEPTQECDEEHVVAKRYLLEVPVEEFHGTHCSSIP